MDSSFQPPNYDGYSTLYARTSGGRSALVNEVGATNFTDDRGRDYVPLRRRIMKPSPARPVAKRASVEGSGTEMGGRGDRSSRSPKDSNFMKSMV